MDQSSLLDLARAILEQPTAPFHEDRVRAEIERQLTGLPNVSMRRDGFGNVIASYRHGAAQPRYAFAAHMDHPGYVEGKFLGGVPEAYRAKNPPTVDFGKFAMWDLPAFEVKEGRIYSRACDDLIGCVAIVAMLKELAAREAETAVEGLFTRGEEVGFVGAIQMARSGELSKDLTVVSLETSSERGGMVRMGEGVIARVGDRTSIFDSGATAQLVQLARQHGIRHQRALMSGGTCEATAYQLYSYRTAGLCVALGNYHNCAPEERIDSEFVSIDDVDALVQLCLAAASAGQEPDLDAAMRARLETDMLEYERYF